MKRFGILIAVLLTSIVGLLSYFGLKTQSLNQPTAKPMVIQGHQLPTPTLSLALSSVDHLFESTASALPSDLDRNRLLTIMTTGDVIPARGVDAQIRKHDADFPFALIGDLLHQADLTIVNLEAPLITNCPIIDSGFTLCGRPPFAAAMAKAGIDVATLANNHITNFDRAGVAETIQHLTEAHLEYATDSRPAMIEVKGLKIGILAFNGVGGPFNRDDMRQQLTNLRSKVDLLLVAFHWGKEYELLPQSAGSIAPDDPVEIGHLAVEAGADLVIGNHPHWAQGVEIYKGKFISYALGNFIFDQSWSLTTQQGVVGKYTFYDHQLIRVEYLPIHIYNQSQPQLADPIESDQILDQMRQSTAQLRLAAK